ncbi:hypothetical protein IKQ65_01130 [Candidatus Saccharibacteria bacterium]|nr:hypothetical protein [Candidatus Saccharibacteria bacterium]MBR6961664.1 hypothetical protein [Candidatus Saccharibacteria bacterium]
MNEEEKSVFHLPTNIAPAIAPVEQISYSDSFSRKEDKISDKDLFNELDAISEEVISCRNHVLEKIS